MKQEQDGLSSLGDRIKQKTPPFFKKLRTIGLVVAAIGTSLVMAPVALPVLVTTIGGYLIVGGTVLSTVSQTAVESKN
jgi:hypothetical protein